MVTLDTDGHGRVSTKCQVTDYCLRGAGLAESNVIDFFINSYEINIDNKSTTPNVGGDRTQDYGDMSDLSRVPRQRGRPRHERIPYLPAHPKSSRKQRIIRGQRHNNLPNFIGRYFPRRDVPDRYPFYCASMLMLLKPWRNIETDLKLPTQTWESAFEAFISTASWHIRHIISGIQYFHECQSSAQRHSVRSVSNPELQHAVSGELELEEDHEHEGLTQAPLSEEGLAQLIASQIPWREELHGRLAVEAARVGKAFKEVDDGSWTTSLQSNGTRTCSTTEMQPAELGVKNADGIVLQNLLLWKQQMVDDVNKQNPAMDIPRTTVNLERESGDVTQFAIPSAPNCDRPPGVWYLDTPETSEQSLTAVDPSLLRYDQFRAYDIITWHLDEILAGRKPLPLRMLIHGEGGTGKSKVIQTTTEYFAQRGSKFMLLKAAYTGVAASLIDGKTTHTIGFMSRGNETTMSAETRAKLQAFWKHIQYLVIDEMSMISKSFLAKLSRNISIGKMVEGEPASPHSFGGVSVIMCGDFFQFPPVACVQSEALYFPITMVHRNREASETGRIIFEEFTTVVTLKEQMRVVDPEWRDFLRHLRFGRVQEHHIKMLRSLVLTNPGCMETDFSSEPWTNASLVTPRHAVRRLWNEAALQQHGHHAQRVIFQCHAEDTIKGQPLTLSERYAIATRASGGDQKRKQDLPATVEVAIGMQVMVTQNVQTDLDITNGARGTVVDILLSPDEPRISQIEPVVKLKHLPVCVLVKLNCTRATQLKDLEESVIPVEPASKTFQIKCKSAEAKVISRTVRRRQFPMTAAYAFTDYRSQGQTIQAVMVDIATPPTGGLTLFNLYVALSRSSGRSTIRLLRDFDDKLFRAGHCAELLAENDRIDELNNKTSKWWKEMGRDTRTTEG